MEKLMFCPECPGVTKTILIESAVAVGAEEGVQSTQRRSRDSV